MMMEESDTIPQIERFEDFGISKPFNQRSGIC
jgi:hypothetical protein